MTLLKNFLHGADYNPEQWLDNPDILSEDVRLMKLSGMNVMALGIFSWANLEPKEGVFDLDYLAQIIDRLYKNDVYTILATPTGARPAWMAHRYPEVVRTNQQRQRGLFGGRHNHCLTSPIYREKAQLINSKLAERFGKHPGLLLWHISNEYAGACYCETCEQAFREWLQNRYDSIEALNKAWWADFWSARYEDWSQVRAPHPNGQFALNALYLDWKRFVSDLTIDFCKAEVAPLREFSPDIPITTNFHPGGLKDIDHWKFARDLDIVSWDNYPQWHQNPDDDDLSAAMYAAFNFDLMRSLKQKPFLMMESAPGNKVWGPLCPQKAPGLHRLSSIQAIAHGSDSVQYFQWRKSRGGCEKWHGAVVDHAGHEDTRMFREITKTSATLSALEPLVGAETKGQVGILFDWENLWALESSNGPANAYYSFDGCLSMIRKYHRALLSNRVTVDFVSPDDDFSSYDLLVAPLFYSVPVPLAKKMRDYVGGGGVLIGTPLLSSVNEADLFHLGGLPGELMDVFGLRAEEFHSLEQSQEVSITMCSSGKIHTAHKAVELLRLIGAEPLASFSDGIYANEPAITTHSFGKGKALYLAAELEPESIRSYFDSLLSETAVRRIVTEKLPDTVYATERENNGQWAVFLMNFSEKPQTANLEFSKVIVGRAEGKNIHLDPWGLAVLTKAPKS